MRTLYVQDSARIFSISSGVGQAVRLSSAIQFSKALLDVAAHLRFDDAERKEEGLLKDLNGELAMRVVITRGDAFTAECAGGAGEVDSVRFEALAGGGILGVGEGNFDHASSVRVSAVEAVSAELCRGAEAIF